MLANEELPLSEEQANSLLIEAESSFEAGLVEAASDLYRKASLLFTKLASTAKSEARLELFLAKAAYCDFMRAYCEALVIRSSIDGIIMSGREIDPSMLTELKRFVRLAFKCLKEAVRRAERLREPTAQDERLGSALMELLGMIRRKTGDFLDFTEQVEHL